MSLGDSSGLIENTAHETEEDPPRMPDQPRIELRPAQTYVAIRSEVTMQDLPAAVDRAFRSFSNCSRLEAWRPLGRHSSAT
jgi:hypothetical protein